MSRSIRNLWPAHIRSTVQSPRAILEGQARALTAQTNGVLVGDVVISKGDTEESVIITLDIVVPLLGGSRHRVLTARHTTNLVYPVTLTADIFRKSKPTAIEIAREQQRTLLGEPPERPANRASSDQEFIELVGKVLQSESVVAVAQSLLARAADAAAEQEHGQSAGNAAGPSKDVATQQSGSSSDEQEGKSGGE